MYLPSGRKLELPKEISVNMRACHTKVKIDIYSLLYRIYCICSHFKKEFMNLFASTFFLESPFCILILQSNMQKNQQMSVFFFILKYFPYLFHPQPTLHGLCIPPHHPSPREITSFRMSCSASQQQRVQSAQGLNFSDAPQCLLGGSDWGVGVLCVYYKQLCVCERPWLSRYVLSDYSDWSHGCLAGWNVLSMVAYVSQGLDTCKMLKCFLLWDPWRPSHPYHYGMNLWGASWLPTHSHLSFLHRWACWGPAEPSSPACLPVSGSAFLC